METIKKLLEQCFKEQYSENDLERYKQIDRSRKILFIDDLEDSGFNKKTMSILLGGLERIFPSIIITVNDLFEVVQSLVMEEQEDDVFENFRQYVVMEFGHELRSSLINKWNTLGIEENYRDDDLIRKNDEAKRIMDTIIGKNLVPSYPFFLLTILQTIEVGHPHDLQESSYGHYYQFLITQSIGRVIVGNDKIDAIYNFITELANYFFENKIREISLEKFATFHTTFKKEYAISATFVELFNFDQLAIKLVESKILENESGIFRFQYKYVYYFFAAKYIANNISRADIKDRITKMCKRLHKEEFANIVIFLTHHSKDPFINSEIVNSAKEIFSEYRPVSLEKDIDFVNALSNEIPKLLLKNYDVKRNREGVLKFQDQLELLQNNDKGYEKEFPDLSEDLAELDIISQLNLFSKTVEVLGQILKNYHSSLKADEKFTLTQESFNLGLRALALFYQSLGNEKDDLMRLIQSRIKKENVDEDKIPQFAQRLIFNLCSLVTLVFIKLVSSAIGSEHLSETFKEVVEKNGSTSYNVVDLSIKLDFFSVFPFEDIGQLKKNIGNNRLVYDVICHLVENYVYMFPTDYKMKQRIDALLNMPMGHQRLIDVSSTQKRRE